MTHSMQICEYGQVHAQCRCPSPVKQVVNVKCNMVRKHKAVVAAAVEAEVNHETVVETALYRIETFAQRHNLTGSAVTELAKIGRDLREALDREPPDDVA